MKRRRPVIRAERKATKFFLHREESKLSENKEQQESLSPQLTDKIFAYFEPGLGPIMDDPFNLRLCQRQ